MRHEPVTSATRRLPRANGGALSTAAGGVGGGAKPAKNGGVNAKSAPWHAPPYGGTPGVASCQVPPCCSQASTATTWPASVAAVAGDPMAVAAGSPPGGTALGFE